MLNLDIVFSKIEILIFVSIEIEILISWMHGNFSDTCSRKLCVCATVFYALLGCSSDGCKSNTNSLKKL